MIRMEKTIQNKRMANWGGALSLNLIYKVSNEVCCFNSAKKRNTNESLYSFVCIKIGCDP